MKKLFRLILVVGAVLLIKEILSRRAEWQGLTESQAHAKVMEKLSQKLDTETAEPIAASIVAKLLARGIVLPDPVS